MKTTKLIALIALIFSLSAAVTVTAAADASSGASGAAGGTLPTETEAEDVVRSSIAAYYPISFYSGIRQNTNLTPSDLMQLKINDHGGIGTDGHGEVVFRNFATLSLKLMTENAAMELKRGNAKIISEKDYTYHGSHVGEEWTRDLKTMVGYGVVLISRENKDGSRELYEELYIRNHGAALDNIRFTEDGNYHIVILMTVEEDGKAKKMAVEYTVPVRTSIYVTDEAGDYHVKNEGAYYGAVRLDALKRPGVRLTVNGVYVSDGAVLKDVGEYEIAVYGAGYLSEKFTFRIFSPDEEHAYIYLSNVRAQMDAVSYECEHSFRVTWSTSYPDAKMTYWKNGNSTEVFPYESGEVISEAGIYIFELNIPSLANEKKSFLVNLTPDDSPINNYNTLHRNRFNNFKTKWLEVYDEESGIYYCYAPEEYTKAQDKAIAIELSRVTDYGKYQLYCGKKYYDRGELTASLDRAAADNIRTVYYDPKAEQTEKYFSDGCFDGTVYLNSDFEFVRTSPAETEKVTLTDEDGAVIEVDYFTPMSSYGLSSGKYLVREVDRYGNATEYECAFDGGAPEFRIKADGVEREVYHLAAYSAKYFELSGLYDALDPYALIAVGKSLDGELSYSYYLKGECKDVLFTEPAQYSIRAYDRNGNTLKMTVNIDSSDKQYSLKEDKGGVLLTLSEGASVTDILKSGEPMEIPKGGLYFPALDEAYEYTVKTERDGVTDISRFTVEALSEESKEAGAADGVPKEENEKEKGGMSYDAMIITVVAVAVLSLGALSVILIFVWRRRNE